MSADEAENLRVDVPHEGQSVRQLQSIGNGLIRPPGLPEPWSTLHQSSDAWSIENGGVPQHYCRSRADSDYLPKLNRFSISGQFTTFHQAAMYSGRRF
jgi:hypothetical protein